MINKEKRLKKLLNLNRKSRGELNRMANRLLNESVEGLLNKHIYGGKTEQLDSFNALVKKFPEYKIFCYPETFLRDNDLWICKDNCDFVRRSAFYDMVNNYEKVKEYCGINPEDIDTALIFRDWEDAKMRQPSKEEIEELREEFEDFITYKDNLISEINNENSDYEDSLILDNEDSDNVEDDTTCDLLNKYADLF